jgi:hypothetical protein
VRLKEEVVDVLCDCKEKVAYVCTDEDVLVSFFICLIDRFISVISIVTTSLSCFVEFIID